MVTMVLSVALFFSGSPAVLAYEDESDAFDTRIFENTGPVAYWDPVRAKARITSLQGNATAVYQYGWDTDQSEFKGTNALGTFEYRCTELTACWVRLPGEKVWKNLPDYPTISYEYDFVNTTTTPSRQVSSGRIFTRESISGDPPKTSTYQVAFSKESVEKAYIVTSATGEVLYDAQIVLSRKSKRPIRVQRPNNVKGTANLCVKIFAYTGQWEYAPVKRGKQCFPELIYMDDTMVIPSTLDGSWAP